MNTLSLEISSLVNKSFQDTHLKQRDLEITFAHHGWDGKGNKSLEETGGQFNLTRERVRQISSRVTSKLRENTENHFKILVHIMDRLESMVPARADCIESTLRSEGLDLDQIEGAIKAAQLFLDRGHNLRIISEHGKRFVLIDGSSINVGKISSQAQKQCSHMGVVYIPDLMHLAPGLSPDKSIEFIKQVLTGRDDAHIIGAEQQWVWLESAPRNRLISCAHKMLTAFSSTTVDEILIGVNRHYSKNKKNTTKLEAPNDVITDLINAWGVGSCSQTGSVRRGPKFKNKAKLLELELAIIATIDAQPTKMAREKELENVLVPVIDGQTHPRKYNFSIALNYSPLISKGPRRGEYVMTGVI